MAVVGMALLPACANLANPPLARRGEQLVPLARQRALGI